MSDEIKLNINAVVENDNFKWDFRPGQLKVDQSTARRGGHAQTIGIAADEVLDIGDVSTEGYCFLRNLDDTNYITWGPQNGTTSDMEPCGKLKAGEIAVFRIEPGTVLMAMSDTAAVDLDVTVLED